MKKFYLAGSLCLALLSSSGQSWNKFPDNISGLTEDEWSNTISYILRLDQEKADPAKSSESITSILTYLATIYADGQLASRTGMNFRHRGADSIQDQRVLLLLSSIAVHKAEHGDHSLLKKMVLSSRIPFYADEYWLMTRALISLYQNQMQKDSVIFILSQLDTRKYFRQQKDLNWYIYFADVYAQNDLTDEALRIINSSKMLLAGDKKALSGSRIELARAKIYNQKREFDKAEDILTREIRKMQRENFRNREVTQQIFLALSETYEGKGYFEKALETTEQYLRITDGEFEDLLRLEMRTKKAALLSSMAQYAESVNEYEKLVVLYPKLIPETNVVFINLLDSLGQTYLKIDEWRRAYVYFRWAYEMMNASQTYNSLLAIDITQHLAEVYITKGDTQSAAFHLQQAQKIMQSFP
jgi:tetratricopeptide (TPR) repeat protein